MAQVIFDFDGTICDSFPTFLSFLDLLAERYHFKRVDPSEVELYRNLPAAKIIKRLEIPPLVVPLVMRSARKLLGQKMDQLMVFDGMIAAIQNLQDQGVECGCLTSNSKQTVESFLRREGLALSFVHAGSSLFGKARLIRLIMRQRSYLVAAETYYVGDETRDIEASKSAGIKGIAVTWGYNAQKILKAKNPDFCITSPEELMACIER